MGIRGQGRPEPQAVQPADDRYEGEFNVYKDENTGKIGAEEPLTNPKDRLGIKKIQLNLVPAAGIFHEAAAMEDGAQKYGPFNWRDNNVRASIYFAAALRHLYAWFDGEECAEDSGCHHLGHARACLGILLDAMETGSLGDDRPSKGAAARLIYESQERE
jgi:hypothetical protein